MDEEEDEDAELDRLLREHGFPPSQPDRGDDGVPPRWDDLEWGFG